MSKITAPSAMQLAAANLKGFFKSPGAFRSGPRTRAINTSAPTRKDGGHPLAAELRRPGIKLVVEMEVSHR